MNHSKRSKKEESLVCGDGKIKYFGRFALILYDHFNRFFFLFYGFSSCFSSSLLCWLLNPLSLWFLFFLVLEKDKKKPDIGYWTFSHVDSEVSIPKRLTIHQPRLIFHTNIQSKRFFFIEKEKFGSESLRRRNTNFDINKYTYRLLSARKVPKTRPEQTIFILFFFYLFILLCLGKYLID